MQILAADKPANSETYNPARLVALVLSWDDEYRFPLLDVLRALALLSPALGSVSSGPADLLKAGGWGDAWVQTKPQTTNQLLAVRALANLFNTAQGRKTMAAASEQGLLVELTKGRKWAEVGNARQPMATVALK